MNYNGQKAPMFSTSDLLGGDIEKHFRMETVDKDGVHDFCLKEEVIEEMVDTLIYEMMNRLSIGKEMNKEALKGLISAKEAFLSVKKQELEYVKAILEKAGYTHLEDSMGVSKDGTIDDMLFRRESTGEMVSLVSRHEGNNNRILMRKDSMKDFDKWGNCEEEWLFEELDKAMGQALLI